jgi:actin-related protein
MQSEEITSIMIDIGGNTIRAGYCGEDLPKHEFSSYVYYQDMEMEIENEKNRQFYLGDKFKLYDKDNINILQVFRAG